MSRRGLYAMAAMAAVGLFVLVNFRQLRPRLTRFVSSDSRSFNGVSDAIMNQKTDGAATKSAADAVSPSTKEKSKENILKIPKEEKKKANEKEKKENAAAEKERKKEAEELEKKKVKLMEEDSKLKKEKKDQENLRQQLEKQKQELEEQKKWLKEEMKRFEDYKKVTLNKSSPVKGNKTGDPVKPDKKEDVEATRKRLESLREKTKGLFQDLDPVEIHKKWPGLLLDGDYMLKEFVDAADTRALGMQNKPQKIEDMTATGAEERFYQLMTLNHMHCADKRRMGNFGDGGWDICVAGPFEPQEGCIVYSFGINNDFTFDDAMGQVFGCQVKSYDPSMAQGDHKRNAHVFFYKIGLGSSDTTGGNGWKLMTLGSIFEKNGHKDKKIDYLKIDIEYNEWAALEVVLKANTLKNVKQFAIEIHTAEVHKKVTTAFDFLRYYNVLLGLEKQGFRRYHYHFNPYGRYTSKRSGKDRSCCYEIYYININFLKDS